MMLRFFAVLLGSCLGFMAWAQGLKVTIAPETLYVGDVMTVSVEAAGVQLQSVECLFSKPVQHAGQMTSMQNVNGHVSMQLGIRKVPLETGEYRLERLTARTTSGELLTYDQHPVVTVQALVANPDYQLKAVCIPEDPFPGDEAKIVVSLSAPALTVNGGKISPFIEQNFFGGLSERAPNITFDAQTTEDTPLRLTENPRMLPRETAGNRLVWTFEIPYHVVRPGEQHFPAPRLNDIVVTGEQNGQLQTQRVMAMGEPLVVTVLAPPIEGRPKGFTGAIGTFFVVDADVSALNVNVGDPLQLILTFLSDGDETLLRAPMLPEIEGFRAYGEPTRKRSTEGTQFIYNLRPIQSGLLEIPPMDFAWFDRATRTYQTLTTPAIPLYAKPSAQLMLMDEEGGMTAHALPPALELTMGDPPRTTIQPWALWGLLLGAIALVARCLADPLKRLVHVMTVPFAKRRPTVRACAMLAHAKTPAEAANAIRFWAGRPALTASELRALLPVDPRVDRVVTAYASLETAMYTGSGNVDAVIEELRTLLPKLPRPRQRKISSMTVILLGLLLCVPCRVHALDDFVLEQAKAVTLSATSRSNYAQAANLWLSLAAEGENRREVFLNGATCALFAEAPTVARQLLRSYDYFYGSDQTSQRAWLAVAEALETPLHWSRTVFAPHYCYSFAERRDLFLGLLGGFLLLCAIPWHRIRSLRMLLLILTLTVGASVFVSWVQDRSIPPALPMMEVES